MLEVIKKNWHEQRRCSRSPLGGRLATTLVATKNVFIFFVFFAESHLNLVQSCLAVFIIQVELARAVGVAVGRRSGERLATTLVDRYFHHYFPFSIFSIFSVATFSHRRSARIKKLIQRKLTEAPQNKGQTPFQTPSAILGPTGTRCDVAGGAALQAVGECPQRRQSGIFC